MQASAEAVRQANAEADAKRFKGELKVARADKDAHLAEAEKHSNARAAAEAEAGGLKAQAGRVSDLDAELAAARSENADLAARLAERESEIADTVHYEGLDRG